MICQLEVAVMGETKQSWMELREQPATEQDSKKPIAPPSQDINELLDDKLQRLNQDLERSVAELTRQLSTANEELQKEIANRQSAENALHDVQADLAHVTRVLAVGELVATIAHEVSQPLTGVLTTSKFALREMKGRSPNLRAIQEAITEVAEDATRISDIISRIRALVKKEAPDKAELNINYVVREAALIVSHEAARNDVQVRLDLAINLPGVLGDRVQLQQVLINLAMNGIDAMRTVVGRPRGLVIKSAEYADGVLIQVQDSGIGLNPDQIDRIFEPFFTTKPQGIGMGLSLSRSIIESHGGRLWAEPGSYGALFQITLPASRTCAA
jgi:C4-dicarboxylate-specific signal transduction histidine kinase